MAFAYGMEIEKYEGRITGFVGRTATYLPVDEAKPNAIIFKGGGLIQRGRDNYALVMPLEVWRNG
jgi:hypothetical protein